MNSSGTTNYIGYNGTTSYTTLSAWQTATTKDLLSISDDPTFNNISLADYMPTSSNVNNIGANIGITDDINGLSRNVAMPDPGCIEFNLAATDLTFFSVTNPSTAVSCYTVNEIVNAVVKNSGSDPLDFSLNPATITVIISGTNSYVASESITSGTLAVGQTLNVPLNPPIDLTVDGSYSVSGSISMVGDGNATNDNLISFNFNVGIIPGTVSSNLPSPSCISYPPTFTLTGQSGGSRQWQLSTTSSSGPWTNVGTGGTTYSPGTQPTDYWVRVESNCNTNYAYSNVFAMAVSNPQMSSTTPGTRCGTGSVSLSAAVSGGTANWYANATGGSPLGSGLTFNTPSISSTTTYYVAPTNGGVSGNLGLANRVGATTNSGYADIGLMFDAYQAFTLNSVAIYPVATTPSGNVTATIALKNSAGTILQSTTVSVATSVSPGIKTVVPLGFSVPPGTGHRLVFTAATGGGITGFIREVTTGYTYPYTYSGVASITSAYTGGASSAYYYYFYDWSISSGCEGTRVPVVATVTPAPIITVTASTTAPCPGSTVDVSVSSPNDPDYTYTWSSVPSGFTGTGNGPLNILPTATTTYSVFAQDNTTGPNAGCTAYGSVVVNAAAALSGGTISSSYTNMCNGEQTTINLTGASGGVHQWQYSTISSSGPWTNTGTGATTFSTGPLSQTTYFRVDEQCQSASAQSNVLTVVVNNPSLSSTTGDTRCGTGVVNLNAVPTTAGNNVNWYANPTGGALLYTGTTYSPTVSTTTTFYAAAATGAGGASTAAIPLANGTTTGVYHHMFMVTSPTGLTLQSMGLKVNDAVNTLGSWNIYYRPDNYQLVTGANTSSTGWILLSSSTNVPSLGTTTYTTISSPFSLVIPAGATYSFYIQPITGTHQYATSTVGTQLVANANVTFVAGHRGSANFNCSTAGGQAVVSLGYSLGCEGTRQPVVATVNAAPTITVSNSAVCSGQNGTLNVSSSNSGYSYTWMPGNLSGATQTVTPSATTTYTVTAIDNNAGPNFGCQLSATQTVTVNTNPTISAISATPNTINPDCNTPVTLSATTSAPVTALLGNSATATTTSDMMVTPYSSFYESGRMQYLIQASELTALGFSAGTINSLGFDVTVTSAFNQTGYTIKMGHTSATALTGYATVIGTLQTVYGPVLLTPPAVGINTYNFSSAFNWNGTDNVIIEICHDNDNSSNTCGICYGTSGTVKYTATTFNSTYGTYNDNSTLCGTGVGTLTNNTVNRPNMYLNGIGGQATVKTWNPGSLTSPATVSPNVTTTYTVTCTNSSTGCSVTGVQTVTVNPAATLGGLAPSYNVTASAVTMTGSPSGGVFSGPGVSGNTFNPSLAGAGTYTISYLPTGYCVPATATVIVLPNNAILNLKCYIEGFYIGSGMMQPVLNNQGLSNPTTDCDTVVVELHNGTSPYATAYTFTGVLQTDGTLSCTFPAAAQGNSYYIVVNHRNAMQTWSANPVLMGAINSYDFSTAVTQAFGDNQVQVATGVFAFYSGDVNQDLSIDAFDYLIMDPDIYNGAGGWLPTDLNGDGSVDAFDYLIYDPNGYNGITVQSP